MNFLAHLHLSGDNPNLMIGNFIGDFVKGRNLLDRFEPGIAKGIELHRSIDEFTDKHFIVQQSKARLRPKYRHYAAVIIDMFYDHYLAKNWEKYHHMKLVEFAQSFYKLTDVHADILPTRVQRMLPYMISGNWLVNYGQTDGIHRALSGMASRTPYDSKMEQAVVDLVRDNELYEDEFNLFFPDVKRYAEQWIKNH